MDRSLGAVCIGLLPLELGQSASADFCEGSLDPFCNLLSKGMLDEGTRRCCEHIPDNLGRLLPHFRARIESQLEDGHERLTKALCVQLGPVESLENDAIQSKLRTQRWCVWG